MQNFPLPQKTTTYGFTLVELIIVVSIIAVLAAFSFIALSGETSNAKDAKRNTDLKIIEDSISSSNAKARTINYGTKTGAGASNRIQTNIGYVGAIRGAKIVEVNENLFDATILPTVPLDPTGSKYLAAFLTDNLYQIISVQDNIDAPSSALVRGSFRSGVILDKISADITVGATSLPIRNSSQFLVGDILTINEEDVTITAIPDGQTLTVTRASNATTAKQHPKTSGIEIKTFVANGEGLICFGTATNPATATVCGGDGAIIHEGATVPYSVD